MTTLNVKLTVSQYASAMRKLGKTFLPTVKRGVLSGALHSLEVVRSNTQHCPPASPNGSAGAVNLGVFYRGWRAARTEGGAVIFNDTPYASVIERGRRPGARPPPSAVLIPWLRRKAHMTEAEAKRLAFVVARAIGRRGQEGRFILEASEPNIIERVHAGILSELDKEIAKKP